MAAWSSCRSEITPAPSDGETSLETLWRSRNSIFLGSISLRMARGTLCMTSSTVFLRRTTARLLLAISSSADLQKLLYHSRVIFEKDYLFFSE